MIAGRAGALLGIAAVCLAALEASIRLLFALNGEVPPHADDSLHREWRWVKRHGDAGEGPLPGPFRHHPQLGWVPRHDPSAGFNSAGMRASREFSEARSPGTPRMVLVGDSLTMGASVGDAEAFHSVLGREFLPDWEVLNLGVSGYGVDQAILRWQTQGARYAPDIAVLGFYHRDYFRNPSRFRSYRKPYFTLDGSGDLVLHDDHLMPAAELYGEYVSERRRIGGFGYSYTLASFQRIWARLQRARGVAQSDPDWQLMAALLRRFRDAARASGAEPFLLVIPERPWKFPGSVFEQIDRLALEEAHSLGMPALSLAEPFHAVPEAERAHPLFRTDGHLTEAGNCELARWLAIGLMDAGLAAVDARAIETVRCDV